MFSFFCLFIVNRLQPGRLAQFELKYGGVQYVNRISTSPTLDSKSREQLLKMKHMGGDRMGSYGHNYGQVYESVTKKFEKKKINVVEVGILNGIGLAIWCDVFPDSKIYGFDLELAYFNDNNANLISKGAFTKTKPLLHIYDQFIGDKHLLHTLFSEEKVNFVIDDGAHVPIAILKTFSEFQPHLSDDFVYIVEDHNRIHHELRKQYPDYNIQNYGDLTVIQNK